MPALKKQRIDLRLTDEDKTMIEEAVSSSRFSSTLSQASQTDKRRYLC